MGRKRVGELAPTKGSRLKKDHRFGVFEGLGVGGLVRSGRARGAKFGIELRRRGHVLLTSSSFSVGTRSRTAPAVLGRESVVREAFRLWEAAGSLSAIVELLNEIMDEMLPETEWPIRAVTVLEVSLETNDNGLGMNSKVSEKPTRARAAGFDDGVGGTLAGFVSVGKLAFSAAVCVELKYCLNSGSDRVGKGGISGNA